MPVNRSVLAGLADAVAASYANAEVRLLRLIARHLSEGLEAPGWAETKLRELQLIRARAAGIVTEAQQVAVGDLSSALATAYLRGAAAGEGDARELGRDTDDVQPRQAERAVQALYVATVSQFDGLRLPVVRQMDDVYRRAVLRASTGTLTGATTRLADAQQVLDDWARGGVSGFTDAAGRRWSLQTYAEMATRTATAQAAVTGHLDRLEDAGIPLVQVSDSSDECERCRPWEGKVLSRGPVAAMMPNVVTGRMERVQVDGTVAEATAAGLFHPNCTHNLSGYLPGATRARDAKSNPQGYADRQRLREMERKVREWKKREAAAMSPEAERAARAKVREWQGHIREHVEATGQRRRPNRESVTAAR